MGNSIFAELRHSIITRTTNIEFAIINIGIGARGLAIPMTGKTKFMKKVEIIKNARLDPTEKSTVSTLSSFNFRSRTMA